VSRARRYQDRKYCERLVEFAKQHSSEAFVGCDDPLEAAIFSVFVELLNNQEHIEQHPGNPADP
jgi:hypothetical protein